MQILNCDKLISSCCSNYELARLLSSFNNIVKLIQITVPIILLIMVTINFIQMMSNPEEKKLTKKLMNKIIAAAIVFFIPTIVNIILNILSNSYDITACMKASKQLDIIAKNDEIIYRAVEGEEKKSILNNPDDYEKGVPDTNDNVNPQNPNLGPNISTDGSILLIAGHAYPPYCSTCGTVMAMSV